MMSYRTYRLVPRCVQDFMTSTWKKKGSATIEFVFAEVVPEQSGLSHQDIQHWSSSQNEMQPDLYPPHPKNKRLKCKVMEVDERWFSFFKVVILKFQPFVFGPVDISTGIW